MFKCSLFLQSPVQYAFHGRATKAALMASMALLPPHPHRTMMARPRMRRDWGCRHSTRITPPWADRPLAAGSHLENTARTACTPAASARFAPDSSGTVGPLRPCRGQQRAIRQSADPAGGSNLASVENRAGTPPARPPGYGGPRRRVRSMCPRHGQSDRVSPMQSTSSSARRPTKRRERSVDCRPSRICRTANMANGVAYATAILPLSKSRT